MYSKNFLTCPDLDGRDCSSSEASQYQIITARQTDEVPTTILFDAEQNFVAFGYEAENIYAVMCTEDQKKAKTWYYFSQFKMNLHTKSDLSRDTELQDFTRKKKLPATKVFSEAIRYLRGNLLAAGHDIREDDVEWVLTVPAIWTDKARQFMREAARLAGIPDERLSLALEPEAASVLCLEEDRRQGHLGICQPGSRFMVVDNGGGTADITVYEVVDLGDTDNGHSPPTEELAVQPHEAANAGARGLRGILKELHHPTGGPCAGVQVNKTFKDLLTKATSIDAIQAMDKLETLSLERDFEEVKKAYVESDEVFIRLPESGLTKMKEAVGGNKTAKEEELSIVKNRLKLPKTSFEKLFTSTVNEIVGFMKIVKEKVEDTLDTILLVGGFSDCLLLQNKVKEVFPDCKVLIPPDPAAAVLKGAVLFRHDPTVIGWRASAFTYGVEADEPFEQGRHREEEAYFADRMKRSRHVFASFIKMDDIVEVNKLAKSEIFQPCEDRQKKLVLPIYKSEEADPIHTTDARCEKLGEVTVDLQNVHDTKEAEILVEMYVGGIELIVRAKNVNTDEYYSTVCDFLCK